MEMSKLLKLRPLMRIAQRSFLKKEKIIPLGVLPDGTPKMKGFTYDNKAYPWEDVKIEKIDYSGKYGKVPNTDGMRDVMMNQTRYCLDDGLLIWQKEGFTDMLLYYMYLLAAIVGFGYTNAIIYTIMYPVCPKKAFPPEYYRHEDTPGFYYVPPWERTDC